MRKDPRPGWVARRAGVGGLSIGRLGFEVGVCPADVAGNVCGYSGRAGRVRIVIENVEERSGYSKIGFAFVLHFFHLGLQH